MTTIEFGMSSAEAPLVPKPRKQWVQPPDSEPMKTMNLAAELKVDVYITMEGDPLLLFRRDGDGKVGTIAYDKATPEWLRRSLDYYNARTNQ